MLTTFKASKSNDIIKQVQPENGSPGNTGDVHIEINSDNDIFSNVHMRTFFLSRGLCTTRLHTFFSAGKQRERCEDVISTVSRV